MNTFLNCSEFQKIKSSGEEIISDYRRAGALWFGTSSNRGKILADVNMLGQVSTNQQSSLPSIIVGGVNIHPTQKPVELYEYLLSKFSNIGDKILDTHLGSGSSRIAAYNAGLDFVGFEIDRDYFDKQEDRFETHTAQLNIFTI